MSKSKTKKSKPIKSSANQVPSKFGQLRAGEFYQASIAEPNALNRFYHVLATRIIDGDVLSIHFVLERSGRFHTFRKSKIRCIPRRNSFQINKPIGC